MSDDDIYERKKLSLKVKRAVINPIAAAAKNNIESSRELLGWEKEILEIEAGRKALTATILHIERRLSFGYSEALKESLIEYKKQDMQLECEIT
ncbi:hypothetical protein N8865_01815, partial [Francisellaceae bacterium]|nr:hypothetical protein [Francisellaceae bacterium]